MKEYLTLCLQGEATMPLRMEILAGKRRELLERIAQPEDSVRYVDGKQQFYDDVLSGKRPYVSHLIRAGGGNA